MFLVKQFNCRVRSATEIAAGDCSSTCSLSCDNLVLVTVTTTAATAKKPPIFKTALLIRCTSTFEFFNSFSLEPDWVLQRKCPGWTSLTKNRKQYSLWDIGPSWPTVPGLDSCPIPCSESRQFRLSTKRLSDGLFRTVQATWTKPPAWCVTPCLYPGMGPTGLVQI